DFTYTGIDALGQPTGLVKINDPGTPDGEFGQNKDPRAVVTKDLKPNYQDELTLGFEKAFNQDFNFGMKGTFRKLNGGIDDSCDTRFIGKYAAANHYTPDPLQRLCFIFNPGEAVTVWSIDTTGKGRYVTATAAELGYPKAERRYAAIDMFAEHPFRNGWYGKLNYTLSRSYGNMEGQTRSDTQQSDIGISAAWDFPEFMANAKGVLPNDRTHVLKAYGFYEINSEWSLGGNMLLSSGRPKVCLGTNKDLDGNIGYGPEYFYCDGKVSPRGSLGRMPTEKRVDMNISYKPSFFKELALKMDIFNLTNDQTVLTRRETRENSNAELQSTYGEVRNTAFPRSVKFSVEYNHKF
ncbi:MAG: TetR family transcriptional regulator, partial [Undibacterium sp.]|nr:TetR family transcriptional regulator [Undibacterium sp.]